jgi:hypothetical protein
MRCRGPKGAPSAGRPGDTRAIPCSWPVQGPFPVPLGPARRGASPGKRPAGDTKQLPCQAAPNSHIMLGTGFIFRLFALLCKQGLYLRIGFFP